MTMMQGLPLTGVPLSMNAKKKGEASLTRCLSHVKTMHKLLSFLYDGLEQDDVYDDDMEGDDEDLDIGNGDSTKYTQIFAHHCFKLVNLFIEPTHGPVELPVVQIVTVISRCLKLSYSDVLLVPSRSDLANLLPCLHQASMDVMSQLILCCGRDILPQSHIIIDLCLQTLASTGKMTSNTRWCTRSSVYQALVVWIQTCGWGKYLSSHRKLLIQEVIIDTTANLEERMSKKSEAEDTAQPKRSGSGKRKGDKKKKGRKGDSYFELDKKDDKSKTVETSQDQIDVLSTAFSLTEHIVENVSFSAAQALITNVVQTAKSIQRLDLHTPDPFNQIAAKGALYRALASCLLSPLDYGCNRNDAVAHYQATNAALSLIDRASQTEEAPIQTICSKALSILKSSSNLNGPVIRKVLDHGDESGLEDVSQLMKEKEEMSDRVEDLRQRLMNSEMENEQQSRLIASLREQIGSLQNKVSIRVQEQDLTNSGHESLPSNIDKDSDDDSDENTELVKDPLNADINPVGQDPNQDKTKRLEDNTRSVDSLKQMPKSKKISHLGNTNNRHENQSQNNENQTVSKKVSKRPNSRDEISEGDKKRPKTDVAEEVDIVENMLLDFVDAPPDT